MGKNPEEEIQKKLIELELSVKDEEARRPPAVTSKGNQLSHTSPEKLETSLEAAKTIEQASFNADLQTLGGLALVALSVVLLCLHIKVGSAVGLAMLMGGGGLHAGVLLVPIFIGFGMLFYNYKSRIAQIVTAGSIALLLFTVLMQLQLYFTSLSLMELLIMVLPVCAGSALMLKGHYKRVAIKSITKQSD